MRQLKVGDKVRVRKHNDCYHAKEGAIAHVVDTDGEFLVVRWLNSEQQDGCYFPHRFELAAEQQLTFDWYKE